MAKNLWYPTRTNNHPYQAHLHDNWQVRHSSGCSRYHLWNVRDGRIHRSVLEYRHCRARVALVIRYVVQLWRRRLPFSQRGPTNGDCGQLSHRILSATACQLPDQNTHVLKFRRKTAGSLSKNACAHLGPEAGEGQTRHTAP